MRAAPSRLAKTDRQDFLHEVAVSKKSTLKLEALLMEQTLLQVESYIAGLGEGTARDLRRREVDRLLAIEDARILP